MNSEESQNSDGGEPSAAISAGSSPPPASPPPVLLSFPEGFVAGKIVGEGEFGKVALATHVKTGGKVAVKILSRDKIAELGTQARVRMEIDHLRRVAAHPHVTRLYDAIDRPGAPSIDLVMEYVGGGDMYDHIRSRWETDKVRGLPDPEARRFFQQMTSALSYMHDRGIVHRDMKLENLLLDAKKQNCKVADLGLSARIDRNNGRDGRMVTPCGSAHYAAPEVLVGEPYDGPPTDVWSSGVILYAIITGFLPFVHEDMKEQFKMIKEGRYSIPWWRLSWGSSHAIRRMLTVDTAWRITFEEIRNENWYQNGLANYLTVPVEIARVDRVIFDQVLKLYKDCDAVTVEALARAIGAEGGFDSETSEKNVYSEDVICAHCAYRILIDAKQTAERNSKPAVKSSLTRPREKRRTKSSIGPGWLSGKVSIDSKQTSERSSIPVEKNSQKEEGVLITTWKLL